MTRSVFIAGGTGYLGRRLIPELLSKGHRVRALAREESKEKLPPGCEVVIGDALVSSSFAQHVHPSDTFVQLVGVPRPSPAKARQFQIVDLPSIRASVAAAVHAQVEHFVYVSVAQPAPVMKAYIKVRAEGERMIHDNGLNATILRPWYVLGPGHRWPYALSPVYKILELIPSTRQSALRLGLVTIDEMTRALVQAVERPCTGVRVLDVANIKST
ncbi:MAG: NAD(P)H-binding protein [Pyrinomonadaceae bacterium]|nr:NAD(P)H-binding protein [Pyrinomonadaceae bacterium]